jgi:hypothetical protein
MYLPLEGNDNNVDTKWYSPSGIDAELLLTFPSTVVGPFSVSRLCSTLIDYF